MLEELREIIAENLGINAEDVTENASFQEDLGADSLDLFELVMASLISFSSNIDLILYFSSNFLSI